MSPLSRRGLLASIVAVAGGVAARPLGAGALPGETGLSSEGLLVGHPGFQPRTVMPLPHEELGTFLSREQLALHHAEYVRDVERLQATEQALRAESTDASRYAELRHTQVRAGNAVLLHELYFTGLSPAKVAPPAHVDRNLVEHMGSWERWRDDFTRCALAAKTWAALVYDPYDDRWHDAIMEGDDDGVWIGANPLVVCDVSEHAYAKDYPDRAAYVAAFLEHVDWVEVSRRYKMVDRM
jgi:Fe-Mn family superoxide dismutase